MKKRLTEKGARRFIADAHSAVNDLIEHPRVTDAQMSSMTHRYVSDYVGPAVRLAHKIRHYNLAGLPDTLTAPLAAFVQLGVRLSTIERRKRELLDARKELSKFARRIDV